MRVLLALAAAALFSGCTFVYSQQNAKDQSSGASTPPTGSNSSASSSTTGSSSSSGTSETSSGTSASSTSSSSSGGSGTTVASSATGSSGSSSGSASSGTGTSSGSTGGSTGCSWTFAAPTLANTDTTISAIVSSGDAQLLALEGNSIYELDQFHGGVFIESSTAFDFAGATYLAAAPPGTQFAVLDDNGLEIADTSNGGSITATFTGVQSGLQISFGDFGNDPEGLVVLDGNGGIEFPINSTDDFSFPADAGMVSAIAQGDLDNIGGDDLVVAAQSSLLVYLNAQGGSPGSSHTTVPLDVTDHLNGVAVADLNQDGNLDLVAISPGDSAVYTVLGDGSGDFAQAGSTKLPLDSLWAPQALQVADLNRDKYPDLVIAESNGSSGRVGVLLGDGSGGFKPQQAFGSFQWPTPQPLAIGDFNGDTWPDVAFSSSNSDGVYVLLGSCAGP